MKPPKKSLRSLSDIRVTRKTNIELKHGDSHGWAVSYADLLMVMLSFFVLYFSFAEESPATVEKQIHQLAMAMKGISDEKMGTGRGPSSEKMQSLAELLKVNGIKVSEVEDYLLLELDKGVFDSADYVMRKDLRSQVDIVLQAFKPFQTQFALTVIGHADKRPLIPRNQFLQDNFDLSSLRALNVMKYMISQGIPEHLASARAAGSHDRDARSITLQIRSVRLPSEGENI